MYWFWPDSIKTKSRSHTLIKTVITESYQAMKHICFFNSELPSWGHYMFQWKRTWFLQQVFFSSWTTKIRSVTYVVYQRSTQMVKRKPEHFSQPVSFWWFLYFFSKGGKTTDISCRRCQSRHLFSISCTYPFLRAYYELRHSSGHISGLCKAFLIWISKLHTQKFTVLYSNSIWIISLLNSQGLWVCSTREEVSQNRREWRI